MPFGPFDYPLPPTMQPPRQPKQRPYGADSYRTGTPAPPWQPGPWGGGMGAPQPGPVGPPTPMGGGITGNVQPGISPSPATSYPPKGGTAQGNAGQGDPNQGIAGQPAFTGAVDASPQPIVGGVDAGYGVGPLDQFGRQRQAPYPGLPGFRF